MEEDLPLYVGTSGWVYKDWSERFFPRGIKANDALRFYSDTFNTVEVNATFYRLIRHSAIESWNRQLPSDFHMVTKGSRYITHIKRLYDCEQALARYFQGVEDLETLKVILWQLPPNFKFSPDVLRSFLRMLPKRYRHAVEFRNQSWWNNETRRILEQAGASFVSISHPTLPNKIEVTTDFVYVRFHGKGQQLYRYKYNDDELDVWAQDLAPLLKSMPVYAFFNNDYSAHAPEDAMTLILKTYEAFEASYDKKKGGAKAPPVLPKSA